MPVSGGGILARLPQHSTKHISQIFISLSKYENGASMYNSTKMGKPVNVQEEETIADALGGNIGLENKWTFQQ